MKVLGISAYYHDAAAAIVVDGLVMFAAQEERFTRVKNDPAFPANAIRFCLEESGCTIGDLDYIAFYDKPFLKFERLLETYYAQAPRGFRSFAKAMPAWLKEKLFIKQNIRKKLKEALGCKKLEVPIVFLEHHHSHAASAFYTSPFGRCAFLTVDGVGEWATTSYGVADGRDGIKVFGELHFPDSLGLLYSSFTYFLGFEVNSGEYKMMGLAPYSDEQNPQVASLINLIMTHLLDLKADGSFRMNQDYFDYTVGLKMVNVRKWEDLFGFKRRFPHESLTQQHADLAFAAQQVLETILLRLIAFVKRETKADNLCLAGGVALNCVANARLYAAGIFEEMYAQPAAGDAGGALGAALAVAYLKDNVIFKGLEKSFNVYLGPRYSELHIERMLKAQKSEYQYFENSAELIDHMVESLVQRKVLGCFFGRIEFGPRALGNRSILADPRDVKMQEVLNLKIKFREGFRPFAPVVCEEDYEEYFEAGKPSFYMLFTSKVKKSKREELPLGFGQWTLEDKRQFPKSELPAVTHVDFSARVQVVRKAMQPFLWRLLQAYKQRTGCGVLINTSFNVKDEPIVNRPEDAWRCFVNSGMDVLVLEHYVTEK